MDVPSLMRQAARFHAQRPAIITRDAQLTYEDAWRRGVRLANAMIRLGVGPGDRVGMVEDNSLPAVDLILGAAIAGAVRVPLYARNSRAAHRAMIESTGCRLVFADPAYADSVHGLDTEAEALTRVLVRDGGYENWLAAHSDTDPMVEVAPDDWYIIRHSSGTSGNPKGVGYRQHDWIANCRNWFVRLPRLSTDSVVGHAAPVSHASGYLFIPTWLEGGANLLFGSFEPEAVLEMSERHQVTHTFLAPSMVAALCSRPGAADRDWSSLVCIVTGGSPITDATIAASRATFGDVLHQVFGQTEATPLTMMRPGEWFADVPGSEPLRSAGKVLPYARVEIYDEDGAVLPPGEVGEIYAQIEGQMSGYWGDPQLSKDRLRDGWVRTGDIGRLDGNGYLYVLDRVDDMIVSGGFNIWPSELETVIADHPAVREVAVFGVPDAKWGETPMAVCYVDASAEVTSEEIITLVAERMGSYLKPSRVEFTHVPLPKSVVGKVLRRKLREPYWEGRGTHVSGA
ncbi:class I adenylate-forming enzyme family protein [Streptomyces sp. NPDC055078]